MTVGTVAQPGGAATPPLTASDASAENCGIRRRAPLDARRGAGWHVACSPNNHKSSRGTAWQDIDAARGSRPSRGGFSATVALAQEKVLRIGMTAADIPRTLGQPDQGFEGNRFTGIPIYDALTHWDLSKEKEPSVLIPGLATEWKVTDDKTKWQFKLRPGVKFHDGSDFNAAAVVWNVQKVLDKSAPHFDPSQVGVTASRMPTLRSARMVDDMTVELTTSEPDSFLPINLTNLFMASPTHWDAKLKAVPASVTDAAERAKQAWAAFAADPSGSGPFRVTRFVSRERLELAKNPAIGTRSAGRRSIAWCSCRCPRQRPHGGALVGPGRLDRGPGPGRVPQIKSRGFAIYQNAQPHVWPWQLSFAEGSPWLDKRVRHAANLCVNRAS
jgi:ABC-type transport system substrate-binding protein